MDLTVDDKRIGTVLGERYKIIERIGTGGMGVVYRGERLGLNKPVAIKFIQEFFTGDEKLLARFKREAEAMSVLSHPCCVSVIDYGVDGTPYIVMEFVTGNTLKDILADGPLNESRAISITLQILGALSHAHELGIVHRDIKPENIMLTDVTGMGEQVRIFDFGLAKLLDVGGTDGETLTSAIIGTPQYMSPEQSMMDETDERTDIYSIGVVLFEMLTGQKLFLQKKTFEILQAHRETVPPTLEEAGTSKTFSKEIEAVVAQALEKSKDNRFQTAEAFSKALSQVPELQRRNSENTENGGNVDNSEKNLSRKSTKMRRAMMAHADTVAMESLSEETLLSHKNKNKDNSDKAAATVAVPSGYHRAVGTRRAPLTVFIGISLLVGGLVFWWLIGSGSPKESEKKIGSGNINSPSEKLDRSDKKTLEKKTDKASVAPAKKVLQKIDPPVSPNEPPPPVEKTVEQLVAEVKTLEDINPLIKAEKFDAAIGGLKKLRREKPKNPYIVFLMGTVYFDKEWWGTALEFYTEAIRLNPVYKKRRTLILDAIEMLGSDLTYKKSRFFIVNKLGKNALPYLKRTAKRGKTKRLRIRAGNLVKQIKKNK